jgi:hypothetical protein
MAIEWKYRGRIFNLAEIESIRRLIAANPEASRWALSRKLCEAWDWKQPNGALRDMVCRGLLLMLERARRDRTSTGTPPSAGETSAARSGDTG